MCQAKFQPSLGYDVGYYQRKLLRDWSDAMQAMLLGDWREAGKVFENRLAYDAHCIAALLERQEESA